MDLDILETSIDSEHDWLERQMGKRDHVAEAIIDEQKALKKTDKRILVVKEVIEVFKDTTEGQGDGAIELTQEMVGLGARQVFGDKTYKFEIERETYRRRAIARFTATNVRAKREIRTDVRNSRGNGLQELTGTLLQIAVVASRMDLTPTVFLDDPIGRMTAEMMVESSGLLRELSKVVQIVLTSTHPELATEADMTHYVTWHEDGSAGIE